MGTTGLAAAAPAAGGRVVDRVGWAHALGVSTTGDLVDVLQFLITAASDAVSLLAAMRGVGLADVPDSHASLSWDLYQAEGLIDGVRARLRVVQGRVAS